MPPIASEASDGTAVAPGGSSRSPRPGQLVPVWRVLLTLAWVGAFCGFAAVWKASEEIGIATWWLGPRSDPRPLLIVLVPFAITIVAGVAAASNGPRALWVSLGASAACALVALFDLSRSARLALVELAIALATALVALAALTGRYRTAPDANVGEAVPPER